MQLGSILGTLAFGFEIKVDLFVDWMAIQGYKSQALLLFYLYLGFHAIGVQVFKIRGYWWWYVGHFIHFSDFFCTGFSISSAEMTMSLSISMDDFDGTC